MPSFVTSFLKYQPLDETAEIRNILSSAEQDFPGVRLPFTSDHEGDLMYSIITRDGFSKCLETGFASGSTAVYMLYATKEVGGHVISIDNAQGHSMEYGTRSIEKTGMGARHQLFVENSANVIRDLCRDGHKLDFIYMDGWKNFDHVAYELFLLDQMLSKDGVIFFDDSYMPGVRQSVRLLTRYYGYQEIDYAGYGQTLKLRLMQSVTSHSVHRPYRAFRKITETEAQARLLDPYFYQRIG